MSLRIWKRLFMRGIVWVLIIGGTAFVVFGVTVVWEVFQKERNVKKDLERTSETVSALEDRREALQDTLVNLDTERGIEEEVRNRFPLAKSGEEVIVLLDAKESVPEDGARSENSLWKSFLEWLAP